MQSKLNVAHFANEEAAIAYIESRLWPNGPVCPHCGAISEATRSKGKTTRPGLWNCRACRRPFTVKIKTVFEASHVPLHIWLQTIYLFCSSKKGFATRQLQRTLGCSMKTAWFLGMRVREAMRDLGIAEGPMGGENKVVEADETYVGGKAANRKGKVPPKGIMLSLVERDGKVRSFRVPNVTAQTLKPIIVANVDKASYLMTDDAPVYWPIGAEFIGHGSVNHSAEEYVRAYFWHTNTVENYFSIFKRSVYGCHFHVSEWHLHRYAAERDFVYSHRERLGFDDQARADAALKGASGKRLTYKDGNQTIIRKLPAPAETAANFNMKMSASFPRYESGAVTKFLAGTAYGRCVSEARRGAIAAPLLAVYVLGEKGREPASPSPPEGGVRMARNRQTA